MVQNMNVICWFPVVRLCLRTYIQINKFCTFKSWITYLNFSAEETGFELEESGRNRSDDEQEEEDSAEKDRKWQKRLK